MAMVIDAKIQDLFSILRFMLWFDYCTPIKLDASLSPLRLVNDFEWEIAYSDVDCYSLSAAPDTERVHIVKPTIKPYTDVLSLAIRIVECHKLSLRIRYSHHLDYEIIVENSPDGYMITCSSVDNWSSNLREKIEVTNFDVCKSAFFAD